MFWTAKNIRRIILDFLHQVVPDYSKISFEQFQNGDDFFQDFGISSMQLVELTAHVNAFFQLFSAANPPNLLKYPLLNEWIKLILAARSTKDEALSFKSSGTTGAPRLIPHRIQCINAEIHFLQSIIQKPKRIISFVPSNHIYGFLFTIVLPQKWNIPVYKFDQFDSLSFDKDDLIIGTPFNWNYLLTSFNHQIANCRGISSGAHLDNKLYNSLIKSGFQIIEIYGSSETAGVGYKLAPNEPFSLFPYWNINEVGKLQRTYDQQEFELMDDLSFQNKRNFTIASRKDPVVQVGGLNVNLENIRIKIENIQCVKKATVFAKATLADTIIMASILLENNTKEMKTIFMDEMCNALELIEVPKHIVFLDD